MVGAISVTMVGAISVTMVGAILASLVGAIRIRRWCDPGLRPFGAISMSHRHTLIRTDSISDEFFRLRPDLSHEIPRSDRLRHRS